MSEGRILKFALVGCGRISGKHADAISNHVDNARLVAVCDTRKIVPRKWAPMGSKFLL